MNDLICGIRRNSLLLAISVTFAAIAGCSSGSSVKVFPVKGKVTFNGKPLVGGGSISFMPQGSAATVDAGGEIKEDGTYELSTTSPGDGAMAGDFRVVITQTVAKEPENTEDGQAPAQAATSAVPEADRIPPIYSDYANSPLTAKVEEKSQNELNFDLPSQ